MHRTLLLGLVLNSSLFLFAQGEGGPSGPAGPTGARGAPVSNLPS